MKIVRVLSIVLVAASSLTTLRAQQPELVLAVQPRTEQLIYSARLPSQVPPQLVFADRSVRVVVRLLLSPSRMGRSTTEEVYQAALAIEKWWRGLTLEFQNLTTQSRINIRASDARLISNRIERDGPREDESMLYNDEILHAEFEVPRLDVGVYTLTGSLEVGISDPPLIVTTADTSRFEVRNGTEDVDTRRAYLRSAAEIVASTPSKDRYPRFRALMLELATLEPSNPAVYEYLADIAAPVAPAEETLSFYERALAIARKNVITKYGSEKNLPEGVRQHWAMYARSLSVFGTLIAELKHPNTTLSVMKKDGRKQFFIYREGRLERVVE